MMKLAFSVAAFALAIGASQAQASVLFDNGPVVNSAGLSILTPPAATLGATSSTAVGYALADNFSVTGAGWNVGSLDFYGYQTQTGTGVYTFTSATWSVIAGSDVNTGTVVASGTTLLTNGGLVGYRVTDTTTTNQNRAIFRLTADVTDFNLAAGNYFLTWALTGTGASGPFVPPVLGSLGTGNALQAATGGSYTTLADTGSGQTYDVPFTINGTTAATSGVPEPATWAMLMIGFGGVGFAMRRRNATARVRFA